MTQEQSPFGKVTVSAAIPGLPYSQVVVEVKEGFNPFVAARTFVTRMEETFGKEAIAAAMPVTKVAGGASAENRCPDHPTRALKPSQHGGYYCTAKVGDGYCKFKVAA